MPGWVLVEHVVLADEQEPAMLAQDSANIDFAACRCGRTRNAKMSVTHTYTHIYLYYIYIYILYTYARDIVGDILHHCAT